ncbi:MAG: OmpA family protein [Bacteroidales bacterium]|nr:OmpA family protein [Bacteroidales bacterium]
MKDFRLNIAALLIGLIAYAPLHAQMSIANDFSTRQLKRYAKNSERVGDVQTAIFLYEKYFEKRSADSKVNYALAELYRRARNYVGAADMYALVIASDAEKYPMARYYYAQMLKAQGEYEEASKEFNTFRKDYRGEKDSRIYSRLARAEITGCDSAKYFLESPLNITIDGLNKTINGPHIELSPIPVSDNSFIYASLKIDSLIYFTPENIDSLKPARQFYLARKQGMDWIGGERIEEPFNLEGVETGNGVYSRDGKRFYFTRCDKNWQGNMICSIYRMIKEGREWSEPEKLPEPVNDPNYTTTQPALGRTVKSDREIIYFVSDRPEGKGGLDIWYTIWNDETNLYSKPRNLGSRVNSPGDEMTPYYNLAKRTLYFSSTGIPGLGGLDIFKTFGSRNKWEEAINMGYPLNSSYDDLYYTMSRKEEDGFFVSNRSDSLVSQTCCDNILYYRWNDYIRITVTGIIYPFEQDRFGRKKDLSNFDFMNPDESIQALEGAKVALYVQDPETYEYMFMDRYATEKDGQFYFTLEPNMEYEFRMEGFQYFDSKNYLSTLGFNFSDTIMMPPTWVNVLSDKPIVLENIYYDFNSAELTRKDKNVLDTTLLVLLKEAPEFIIEIGAHTDSIGEADYNLQLSQDRADNVVTYLITKGIHTDRLVARGYGSTMPIAPNFLPDGSDNPDGRERNRRTEFRIIGTIGQTGEDEDEVYIGE